MDPRDEQLVEQLFQELADVPAQERAAVLRARGEIEHRVRERVLRLLALHDAACDPGLRTPVMEMPSSIRRGPDSLMRVGPYEMVRILGEGGMGTVYLARQEAPIHREVALKVIKLGMDTRAVLTRFEAEREALALMNHPNVARVIDAGTTDEGRPYFVMEYVEGLPVTQFCDQQRVTLTQRVQLFLQVCQAVQHAHQKGIIHRDLKPSNVLVSTLDGQPVAKVIDFGIAKATQQKLTDLTYATELGMIVGTPAYMSPEQADPTATDIDTRADIYSLGVILYELLVGVLPLDPDTMRKAAIADVQRIICEVDPPRPSSRISEPKSGGAQTRNIASFRQADPKSLMRQIRGDLDWIVMKCLEKDRTRRYETANALAMELQRYLHHEPVAAGPPSRAYRMRKFVRRYRAAVLTVGLFVLLVFASAAGMTVLYFRAEAERRIALQNERRAMEEANRAEQEADLARRERDKSAAFGNFMEHIFEGVGPAVALGRDTKMLKELIDRAVRRIEDNELRDAPEAEVRLRLIIGALFREIAEYDLAERMLTPAVTLAEEVYGRISDAQSDALYEHALLLDEVDRKKDALPEREEALAISRALFAGDHPDVARNLSAVARSTMYLGRAYEALPLYQEVLAMRRRLFPGDHPDVATSLVNVGGCLTFLGRHQESLSPRMEALDMRRRLFSGDHPDVAGVTDSIAIALTTLGRSAEALPMHEEALRIRQHLFPADHPAVARSLNSVATCLKNLGREEDALAKYEEALAMNQRLFTGDHLNVAFDLVCLAGCLEAMGRSEEGLARAQESLAMRRRIYPNGHPVVADAIHRVCSCLDSLGRNDEALVLNEEALAMCQRTYKGDHPCTATGLYNLGNCYLALGRNEAALQKFGESEAMNTRLFSPDHPRVRGAQIGKGRVLVALERFHDGRQVLVAAWEGVARRTDVGNKAKARCLESLVQALEALEAAEPGEGHTEEAAFYRAELEHLK